MAYELTFRIRLLQIILVLSFLVFDLNVTYQCLTQVILGIDILRRDEFRELKGKRIGIIANNSSVSITGKRTIDLLHQAPQVKLVAIFAPEHGLDVKLAGGEKFGDSRDPHTGVPVYSLYAPDGRRAPPIDVLKNIDVLLYDLQDIGIRPYTYISTMGLAIEACCEAKIPFWVLDRPNPLGGIRVEGPILEPQFSSFIGKWPIPYVYGLTAGELALMIAGERWIKSYWIRVIKMEGWRRIMDWKATGLKWVKPSPLMTDPDRPLYLTATAIVGFIGGISIGLGSPWPSQCFAAPWIESEKLLQWFRKLNLPGIEYSQVKFIPTAGAYTGQEVKGIRFEITDRVRAPLVPLNFYIIGALRQLTGRDLYSEAVARGLNFESFNKIVGTNKIRELLDAKATTAQIIESWQPDLNQFNRKRSRYLLYPE